MTNAWRIPISSQKPSGSGRAHYLMDVTRHKGAVIVTAACGMYVNPEHAIAPKRDTPKCKICKRKMP